MSIVSYAEIDSEIGRLFVAATPRGLCSLRLMCDADRERGAALADLTARFAPSELVEDAQGLRELADEVREVIAGRRAPTKIPLDMPGTDFQRKIWRTLVRVPWGKTVTYAELAGKVGKPKAVRAAASACARNPVAFVVPCHRVVSSNGLGGFGYGPSVKQHLLERERKERW